MRFRLLLLPAAPVAISVAALAASASGEQHESVPALTTGSETIAARSRLPQANPLAQASVKAHGQLGPGKGTIIIQLEPPDGGKLTKGAPYRLGLEGDGIESVEQKGKLDPAQPAVRIPVTISETAGKLAELKVKFSWCTDDQCVREKATLLLELDLSGDAAGGEAFLTYRASPRH